ncbi:NAD-dependent dehydratase [Tersicoccus solisilvae]|uniref:NAD-dependent dehydratase n=1 Tax=Tersicoccus solisilvae TaxID=1882339 RepID=A0ABQ1PKL5_9MICC|nr:SDR family oxidoreductase [Tersicoccus solisilvae]GGC98826.1 NAD-dependent dehydratase [Tersicoccus solisilvae]
MERLSDARPADVTGHDQTGQDTSSDRQHHVLVTGSTGYIGGRLVPRLLAAGHRVRVLVRNADKLLDVPWHDDVEIVQGDLSEQRDTERACAGVDSVYFLVHSMSSGKDFERTEAAMAGIMARSCAAAGVERVIYLGGLHPTDVELSPHMRSRAAVGKVLLDGPTDAVVFQAGVIIGSGSASFEMVRHLAEELPVMPAPSWVRNRIEPIAVRDVLHYLLHALDLPEGLNRTFDIGSREVLTYAAMMNGYATAAGLPRRVILALPLPAPRLAGWWVGMVTPIPMSMAFPLVQSLQHDAVSAEHDIDDYIPAPPDGLTGYRRAVELALLRMRENEVETTWAGASGATHDADPLPSDPDWAGHKVYVDERTHHCDAAPEYVWRVIEGIGGKNGWYSLPLAWAVRGWMDKFSGGVGLSRGRRDPQRLHTGEAVDWWRVEHIERGRLLRLRAEMKVSGKAWLELEVRPDAEETGDSAGADHEGGSTYHQRAIFFPKGLTGRVYWLAILPFHGVIFPSMSRNIGAAAARLQQAARRDDAGDDRPATAADGALTGTPATR